jgi:uncharacterized membrane protein YccC
VILGLAMTVTRFVHLGNAYWIPITAAIVTRPAFQQTIERGLARTVGTLAGAGVATLAAWAVHPRLAALAVLVLAFAAAAYVLLFVNYAAFAACVTAYVVFLLTMAGAAERTVVTHRLLATVVGAGLAWLGHALFDGVERTVGAHRSDLLTSSHGE